MKDNDGEEKEDRDVFNLLSQLREEKLFITSEKLNIKVLIELIQKKTDNLVESTWITTKQRLYLLGQREFTSDSYEHVNAIINADFVEAKSILGFQATVKIEKLLQTLRTQPEQFAQWIFVGEQLLQGDCSVLQNIVTGLYSSCIFPEDTKYMLKLLVELAKLQLLKNNDNPRRILKQKNCSFKNLYFIFHEVLVPAKFFLSAALELPILRLLSYKEFFLDLDPEKTLMRYKQNDNNVKSEFRDLIEYRNEVVIRLSEFTNIFISSLRENVYSFPKSISWIVNKISKIMTESFGPKEANAIVTELIFTLYICPAIVDPEQYCICELQISDIARHNLIQIGQLLQILALNRFESPDLKIMDVYKLLDKDIVVNFVNEILFSYDFDCETPVDCTPLIVRDSALFAEDEFNEFLTFLQRVLIMNLNNEKKILQSNNSIEEHIVSLNLPASASASASPLPSPQIIKQNGFNENNKKNFLTLNRKNNHHNNISSIEENNSSLPLTVLLFSIENLNDPIGLIAEEKILKLNKKKVLARDDHDDDDDDGHRRNNINSNNDEKVNYNQDEQGSIGNTSDNLEAISEAASNHSVASSLELENEDQNDNDNLSDMISANVSGRGSPNISGRDTPSSQVEAEEERPALPSEQQRPHQPAQGQINRQIRSEIDDKFCKFEIKKLLEGDENISIISETWSTDVLASDNETVDAGSEQQNLLVDQTNDILETQSESAWSTDVMASDTERLTEVDNDDASSVAQSDDTNARSDDRSEIDDLPTTNRRLSNPSNSSPYLSNFQEFRKIEAVVLKNDINKIDNNANNLLYKSVQYSEIKTNTSSIISNVSAAAAASTTSTITTTSTTTTTAGPSGSNLNYEERPNEILLSNCSLNSSSSGSSSNSFENNKTNENCAENWGSKQWLNSSGSSLNATSTPTESTSELSVLSVNVVNHQNLNQNTMISTSSNKTNAAAAAALVRSLKPSASTGAIPKSISFDVSADKGDRFLDNDQRSKRGGFFGKLRMFRNRRCKRTQDDYRFETGLSSPSSSLRLNQSVSEDILAKYRTKPFVEDTMKENNENVKSLSKMRISDENSDNIDVNNSFVDIKKKIRLVLSDCNSQIPTVIMENRLSVKSKIESVLRLELGKARKLKEWSNIARISEAIRCMNLLNESTSLALLQSMKEDFLQRYVYTQYLICSKQKLLFSDSYLEGLINQVNHEREQCDEYLSTICVKKFLLEEEIKINEFCDEFKELTLSDEKCDHLNNFYQQLYRIMEINGGLWQDIFKNRSDIIKITLERFIISKVYTFALYPNGDGDRHRDTVLFQHIEKLSKIISPDHKDLMINKIYLKEFPWIPAQEALKAIGAYRTPTDKVNCVVHSSKCIMDLLALSQNAGGSTIAADDFTPVLVYVIIRVNPNDLLSTIQFVNSFYQNLCGEEQYWWTQFCAAIEFIKTMDYSY